VKRLLKEGIIEPSLSPLGAQVVVSSNIGVELAPVLIYSKWPPIQIFVN